MNEEFELNPQSKRITFRVKEGEKKEIIKYATDHGFETLSAFIKKVVFSKIRGLEQTKIQEDLRDLEEQYSKKLEIQSKEIENLKEQVSLLTTYLKETKDKGDSSE